MFSIYLITNQINHKIYIGRTCKPISERWNRHIINARCGKPGHFYNAIRKHGPENFTIKQVDCTENEQECGELEILYISIFQSWNPKIGYNSTMGGEGNIPTERARINMSLAHVGKTLPDTQKQKISSSMRGNKYSLGHKQTIEHKTKISISMAGKKNRLGAIASEEAKINMSMSQRERRSREKNERIINGKSHKT